jgi:hypothetical protein
VDRDQRSEQRETALNHASTKTRPDAIASRCHESLSIYQPSSIKGLAYVSSASTGYDLLCSNYTTQWIKMFMHESPSVHGRWFCARMSKVWFRAFSGEFKARGNLFELSRLIINYPLHFLASNSFSLRSMKLLRSRMQTTLVGLPLSIDVKVGEMSSECRSVEPSRCLGITSVVFDPPIMTHCAYIQGPFLT